MQDVAGPHRDLVVKNSFVLTLELALLSYQKRLFLAATSDPIVATAQAQRLIGAQQFIEELLNLGEKTEPPPIRESGGLDYKQ